MENILDNVEFGDKFITKNGIKGVVAVTPTAVSDRVILYLEDEGFVAYRFNGECIDYISEYDIIFKC